VKEGAERLLADLTSQGLETAEVFAKRGRSRHFARSGGGEVATSSTEAGWAVRAGDGGGSFFFAGSGAPAPGHQDWPAPGGAPLVLPQPAAAAAWREPPEVEAPLLGEREGLALLAGLARQLEAEMPGARLLTATLDDGASESAVVSSRGVAAAWRSRAAALSAEAAAPGGAAASLAVAAGAARQLDARSLARRLGDLLAVAQGAAPERDRGSFLVAPAVGARLLAGLVPLFTGAARPAALSDGEGRLGSERLTVVDDGRLADGALAAPADGEGMPTGPVTLVAEGRFRQALRPWSAAGEGEPSGCLRRPGWRDFPRPGPSHLFIPAAARTSVGSLLAELARGYYLIDAPSAGSFDLAEDRFRLPVRGFAVAAGRVQGAVAGAVLTGSVGSLLRGLRAVARDLTFFPLGGMIGTPTLLLTGIEITAAGEE
jgi:predicted Zn-dependent protease